MSSLVPFTFNHSTLYTVDISSEAWTRSKGMCQVLEYNNKTSKLALELSEIALEEQRLTIQELRDDLKEQ